MNELAVELLLQPDWMMHNRCYRDNMYFVLNVRKPKYHRSEQNG